MSQRQAPRSTEGMLDHIVIGAGLIGAAAAKYLAQVGSLVALLGPTRPPTLDAPGVFSSHDDAARIVRQTTKDMLWATLTRRSIRGMVALERETGSAALHRHPGLHLVVDEAPSDFMAAAPSIVARHDVAVTWLPNVESVRAAAPTLSVPEGARGFLEHPPAGFLEPHALIDAQVRAGQRRGLVTHPDVVVELHELPDHVLARTASGMCVRATRALVATGAYAKATPLLRRPLDLAVKSETTVLARVSPESARRLRDTPTLVVEGLSGVPGMVYATPPLRYEDGHHYIKLGHDTLEDRRLDGPLQIDAWMREGPAPSSVERMLSVLRSLFGDVEITGHRPKPCLVTYTPSGHPMIDQVGERIFIATGGNAMGAKASDALGALAARLIAEGRWSDPELDASHFAARFAPATKED